MALATISKVVNVESALKKRVLDLYRQACRAADRVQVRIWLIVVFPSIEIVAADSWLGGRAQILYGLEYTPAQVRHLVKLQFKRNQHMTEPAVIDMLVVQGYMELEETVQQWKQKNHLMELLSSNQLEEQRAAEDNVATFTQDQTWLRELILRAESAAGSAHDGARLAKLERTAEALEVGSVFAPGVSASIVPGAAELARDLFSKSRTRYPDKVLTNQSVSKDQTMYTDDAAIKPTPTVLRRLRDANDLGSTNAMVERDTAVAWYAQRAHQAAQVAEYMPPSSSRAAARLPKWMASRTGSMALPADDDEAAKLADELAKTLPGGSWDAFVDHAVTEFRAFRASEAEVEAMFEQRSGFGARYAAEEGGSGMDR